MRGRVASFIGSQGVIGKGLLHEPGSSQSRWWRRGIDVSHGPQKIMSQYRAAIRATLLGQRSNVTSRSRLLDS